jgi:hypothetical protein
MCLQAVAEHWRQLSTPLAMPTETRACQDLAATAATNATTSSSGGISPPEGQSGNPPGMDPATWAAVQQAVGNHAGPSGTAHASMAQAVAAQIPGGAGSLAGAGSPRSAVQLDLSRQLLGSVHGLALGCPNLRVLHLDSNQLTGLAGLEQATLLQQLSVQVGGCTARCTSHCWLGNQRCNGGVNSCIAEQPAGSKEIQRGRHHAWHPMPLDAPFWHCGLQTAPAAAPELLWHCSRRRTRPPARPPTCPPAHRTTAWPTRLLWRPCLSYAACTWTATSSPHWRP